MIDLALLELKPSEYSEFKELCERIYRFVANEERANLFKLRMEFPQDAYPKFDTALKAMLSDSCLTNGSKGFLIGRAPEFKESEGDAEVAVRDIIKGNKDDTAPLSKLEINRANEISERMEIIKESGSRSHAILSSDSLYHPANVVESAINSMGKGTTKTLLDEYFIKGIEFAILEKKYRSVDVGRVIDDFCQCFEPDKRDVGAFQEFNLPSSVFIYLFNRSIAYSRLFFSSFYTGSADVIEYLYPTRNSCCLIVHRTPNSDEEINVTERAREYLSSYQRNYGPEPFNVVMGLMTLMDNVYVKKTKIKEIYARYSINDVVRYVSDKEWNRIFYNLLEVEDRVKYLPYDNIQSIREILQGINEIKYGITLERIIKSYGQALNELYIDDARELQDFILKYTTYKVQDGRVLLRGSLFDAVKQFVADVKNYDVNRLLKLYGRRCGGVSKDIESMIRRMDVESFANDNPLTSEEERILSDKLRDNEWISKDNARSIFADLHGIEHKFNEINMHKLGFTSVVDVFYRHGKYESFSECLQKNEFVGDDLYVDDRKFKLKMACTAFSMELEKLERYLHWIPVSKNRLINLDSPKNERFAKIVAEYRDKVTFLCMEGFVTPYSLRNTHIGIPEIDDDDYGLEFYDAILISTKANHQTLAKYRFFFIPTDSTSFDATAPEFIRYLVYNNNGSASIDELQAILESDYGIIATASAIRNQVKLSSCIYSTVTDVAYLDDESYTEALRNEPE